MSALVAGPAVNLVALLKAHREPHADGGGWISLPEAIHAYGCPATRMGKKSGPCACSARLVHGRLYEALRAAGLVTEEVA